MQVSIRAWRWLQNLPRSLKFCLLVIAYIIAGIALERFADFFRSSWQIQPWDPAAGLHVTLLLGFGLRYIPATFWVPFLEDVIFPTEETQIWQKFITSLIITCGYGLSCWLLISKLNFDPSLQRLRDVIRFVVVSLGTSLAVAWSYITALAVMEVVDWTEWGARLMHEWAGEATGIAMLAPLLLIGLRRFPRSNRSFHLPETPSVFKLQLPNREQISEWGTIMLVTLVASWAAFGGLESDNLDYTYFVFLPMIWVSVRKGLEKTTVLIVLINLSAVFFASNITRSSDSLALQFGLMVVSYTGLLLAAFVNELREEISQRRQVQSQLRYDATHDSLTGLYNRAWFMAQLERVLAKSQQNQNDQFAVLFIDLDRFKIVNDSLGHPVGDQLLVAIARRLQQHLGDEVKIARLGGDEFAILLENIANYEAATSVAVRIAQDINQSFTVNDYEVFTAASIGIAFGSGATDYPEEIMRDADIALYRAKSRGSNQYAVFTSDMHEEIVRRSQIENELRQAVNLIANEQ